MMTRMPVGMLGFSWKDSMILEQGFPLLHADAWEGIILQDVDTWFSWCGFSNPLVVHARQLEGHRSLLTGRHGLETILWLPPAVQLVSRGTLPYFTCAITSGNVDHLHHELQQILRSYTRTN